MRVKVPDGAAAGGKLRIQTPDGPMLVSIPNGMVAGQSFDVVLLGGGEAGVSAGEASWPASPPAEGSAEVSLVERTARARSLLQGPIDARYHALMAPHVAAFMRDETSASELEARKGEARAQAEHEGAALRGPLDAAFAAYEAAEEGVRAATEKRNAAKAMLEAALDKTEAEAAAAEQ